MRVRPFLSLISIACVFAPPLSAQSSLAVLTMPASVRAAGAGDVAPFATDASAIFYGAQNLPAARTVTANGGTWIGDAQLTTVALSTPLRARRASPVIALGVQSLNYGSVDEIVPDPSTGGTRGTATGARVGGSELAVTLGMHQQTRGRRAGFALTYMRQQIAEFSASAVTMSVASGVTFGKWEADLSAEHVSSAGRNPSARTLTIPTTTRLSISTPRWNVRAAEWRAIGEVRRTNRQGTTAAIGGEANIAPKTGWTLSARSAYLAYADETVRAPWTAGGSAGRGTWMLDYAYQGFGALGAVHRVGITWHSRESRSPSR